MVLNDLLNLELKNNGLVTLEDYSSFAVPYYSKNKLSLLISIVNIDKENVSLIKYENSLYKIEF